MVSVVGAHLCRGGDRNRLSPVVALWCCCRCCRSSYRYRVGGRAATATVEIVIIVRMYDRYLVSSLIACDLYVRPISLSVVWFSGTTECEWFT